MAPKRPHDPETVTAQAPVLATLDVQTACIARLQRAVAELRAAQHRPPAAALSDAEIYRRSRGRYQSNY